MINYYALKIEDEIKIIIPWNDKDREPTLRDVAQTMSYIWGKTGTDFSFGEGLGISKISDKDHSHWPHVDMSPSK